MKKLSYQILLFFVLINSPFSRVIAQMPEMYGRFLFQGKEYYGRVGKGVVSFLNKAPWAGGILTGRKIAAEKVKWLFPSQPGVIVGLAKSYMDSWKGKTPPKTVRWFIKPPTAAAASGEMVVLPPTLDEVKVEGELVIIIGKKLKNISPAEAEDGIFGYTTGLDIVGTVESYHRLTGEPPGLPEKILATGLKICDRFEPYGPWIHCTKKWQDRCCTLTITTPQGKKTVFTFNTSQLLYSPAKIVSDLSRVLTLSPGDVISTGTVRAFLAHPGDEIDFAIEGLGQIHNKIGSLK